jgi:hypothetical protein
MTKSDVIARFTAACSDCDATLAGSLFDEAHQQLCRKFEVYDSAHDVNLTSGTRFIALTNIAKKVVNVLYKPSATASGWKQLLPTSFDELEFYENVRKDTVAAIPSRYYLGTTIDIEGQSINTIAFDKVLPTTTSGGYPIVTVVGQFLIPLSNADSLPDALMGYEMVYVYHMAKAYTSLVAPEKMVYWDQWLNQASAQLRADLMSKEYSNEGASLLPSFVNQLNRVGTW